ncbi:MAG: DUF1330 domain-containing protein [Hyphomicrobiales bacterium]
MSAFVIAQVTVKDGEKFQQYAEQSGPTFAPFGGELFIKGKFAGTFTGNQNHNAAAIIKFPNMEKLDEWYNSAAYQNIIPLRNEAADIIFTKYEVPEA